MMQPLKCDFSPTPHSYNLKWPTFRYICKLALSAEHLLPPQEVLMRLLQDVQISRIVSNLK